MQSNYKPSHILRRLLCCCLCVLFCACVSDAKNGQEASTPGTPEIHADETGTILFKNQTLFTVHLVRGSGRTDVVTIAPGSSESVANIFGVAEDYYPLFDIPLTASYSLSRVRPADNDFYFRIDNNVTRQEIVITSPESLSDTSAYILFTNASRSGGVSLSQNASNSWMTGINFPDAKSNVNVGETLVFRVNPRDLQSLRVNPLNISFGEMVYRDGYVYTIIFDGTTATLTDSRPLQHIGESTWVRHIANATGPAILLPENNSVRFFAPAGRNLVRHDFDSAGNETRQVLSGDSFTLKFASQASDACLVSGYEEQPNGDLLPIARVIGEDGTLRHDLTPSQQPQIRTAYYSSAAHNDNSLWLFSGGAAESRYFGYAAYVRLVRLSSTGFTPVWELTLRDFKAFDPSINCGPVTAAAYNPIKRNWIIAGDVLEYDSLRRPVKRSFVAELDDNGKLQSFDSSFMSLSINKILVLPDGAVYLAGEELSSGVIRAALVKYSPGSKQEWKAPNQSAAYSFYDDAILDITENRMILAGTLSAKAETGQGGVPFIEAINLENGALIWRRELSAPPFTGASIVTGLSQALGFGFVLSLSGMDDYYTEPFIIARVNSQGVLLQE